LGLGGAQTILKAYFEHRADDRTVRLYVLRALPTQVKIAHPNVSVYPSSRRYSLAPLMELRRAIRRERVDVLHCHLFRSQVFGFVLKFCFFPRVGLVFHEHGRAAGREGESALEAFLFRLFLRLSRRWVDCFVCNSGYTRAALLAVVARAEHKAHVVMNPIPCRPRECGAADSMQGRQSVGAPAGSFIVGFASRLVERKGWRDFLEAVQTLSERLPVYFLLAGDGDDREKVDDCIRKLGLSDRGRRLGHIDWMHRFYATLDCFVMPSHWESHGLAHLEAQGFGVPVVVSRVPGLADTVRAGENALLFPPSDRSALMHCIFRIASDSSLRSRLIAGGLANASTYTVDRFSARLDEIHSTICRPGANIS
jgi:glycosyltransferase involved in cell wall biosynthesis